MSGESRGWSGAGLGFALETNYGTEQTPDTWLKVEKESLKENRVPRKRRSIIPIATAAARCAYPASGRYAGVIFPGGPTTIEAVYEGLDKLFYIFFGNPAVSDDAAGAYTHTYPNAIDPPTKPSLTLVGDRDTSHIKLLGAQIKSMSFTVVGEEACQFDFEWLSYNSSLPGSGLTPSWPSEEYVVADWHTKVQIDSGSGYADVEYDGFQCSYDKNLLVKPAHDASSPGIRLPIRAGYPTINGQVVRLYQNLTYYDKYSAGETIKVKVIADGQVVAGTGSTNYGFSIEMPACTITDTGPVTTDEGVRVETISFEVDSDATNTPFILETVNEDVAAWAA